MEQFLNQFLLGSRTTLKQMEEADLDSFIEIENNLSTLLMANDDIPFPNTAEDHTTFFKKISAKKEEFIFGIYTTDTNRLIGSCGVYAINWKNSTCFVGISLAADCQGQGYGTDAMQTLISFIFNYIHINKIKLQVFSFNEQAIRSYEKCGFITEGILRNEIFRFGQFYDVHIMGILREDLY